MTEPPEDTRRCAVCERPQQDCDCDAEGAALDREIEWLKVALQKHQQIEHDLRERLRQYESGNVPGAQWYSIDPDDGVNFWGTEIEARDAAYASLEHYRDNSTDGWCGDVEQIEWGVAIPMQRVTPVNVREAEEGSQFDYICDYELVTLK